MPKRIIITDYPVEYSPYNPTSDEVYYGLPENQNLPDSNIPAMHYHSSYQIGVCRGGIGVFLLENDIYAVKEGDAVIISPDTVHCSRGIKDEACNWDFVYIDPFEMRNNNPEFPEPQSAIIPKEDEKLNSLLVGIVSEGKFISETSNRLASLYFYTFALIQDRNLKRNPTETNEIFSEDAEPDDLYNIMPAIKEIAFRFDESIAVSELAGICKLSESHFTRIFKKSVGMSPYNYTLRFRSRVGAALLKSTDKSVNLISENVGFKSPSDFYRQFVKYYNRSPSDYRNNK